MGIGDKPHIVNLTQLETAQTEEEIAKKTSMSYSGNTNQSDIINKTRLSEPDNTEKKDKSDPKEVSEPNVVNRPTEQNLSDSKLTDQSDAVSKSPTTDSNQHCDTQSDNEKEDKGRHQPYVFRCSFCSATFNKLGNLHRHQQIHTIPTHVRTYNDQPCLSICVYK